MKEIEITEDVTSIVDAKKIIDKITLVNDRYEESNRNTKYLLSNINSAQNSINDVCSGKKGRSWGSLDKDALLDLIKEDNSATSKSISSISKLITNNNENSKLLAEMVGALAMLSGLSFEKISETSAELEGIANQIIESSSGNKLQGKQIKRIVVSQIEKIKEERKRADKVEYNFGIINENIKEINEKLNVEQNKIAKIEKLVLIKSKKDFANTLTSQKKKIKLLTLFSIFNLIIILGIIFYFVRSQ